MSVKTRFAPSPTGLLHLGGARTALFNWLFARSQSGQFLWRIEDTDKARNSDEALASIRQGLAWLGLHADAEPVYQSARKARHQAVAKELLARGHAYWCDLSASETEMLKMQARNTGQAPLYPAREAANSYTQGSVLRLKMPREDVIHFYDRIQGDVRTHALQCEDFVLLRNDESPTYMLAVVVDDHDMGITHVIRGSDHLSNTPKQLAIYQAMGWEPPVFAHIPLIHGADGAKLSKRHGAEDVCTYQRQGFLASALFNALLRLGWGHGNQETFTTEQAVQLFSLDKVGASPARFDPQKLLALNSYYMRALSAVDLLEACAPFLKEPLDTAEAERVRCGMPELVQRSQTLIALASATDLYRNALPVLDAKAQGLLSDTARDLLKAYMQVLEVQDVWDSEALEKMTRAWLAAKEVSLKHLAQPLRAVLAGQTVSPPLFQMMACLGKVHVCRRIEVGIMVQNK